MKYFAIVVSCISLAAFAAPIARAEDRVVLADIVVPGRPQHPSVTLMLTRRRVRDDLGELRQSFTSEIVRDAATR